MLAGLAALSPEERRALALQASLMAAGARASGSVTVESPEEGGEAPAGPPSGALTIPGRSRTFSFTDPSQDGGAVASSLTGILESVADGVLELTTPRCPVRASTTEDTAITIFSETDGALDDLTSGVQVLISGQPNEAGNLQATRITVIPESLAIPAGNSFGGQAAGSAAEGVRVRASKARCPSTPLRCAQDERNEVGLRTNGRTATAAPACQDTATTFIFYLLGVPLWTASLAFPAKGRDAMCGVCGILHKGGAGTGPAPIGDYLVKMLGALSHRGMDSTGVTVAGQPKEQDLILRLRIEADQSDALLQRVRQAVSEVGGEVVSHRWVDDYVRLGVQYGGRDEALPYHARPLRSGVRIGGRAESIADALVALDGVEVHSIGECSEVIKDVGTASDLQQRHNIGSLSGSHGIGHVRMATESRVDITHSHPFWACPYPDVTWCITAN